MQRLAMIGTIALGGDGSLVPTCGVPRLNQSAVRMLQLVYFVHFGFGERKIKYREIGGQVVGIY